MGINKPLTILLEKPRSKIYWELDMLYRFVTNPFTRIKSIFVQTEEDEWIPLQMDGFEEELKTCHESLAKSFELEVGFSGV